MIGRPPDAPRGRPPGKQRDMDREPVDGVTGSMFDDEGFVLPQFREHVAKLRKRPEMCDIGEVVHVATWKKDG